MQAYVIYGIVIVIIIAIIVWLLITKVLKNKSVTNNPPKLTIDVDSVIVAIGGLSNIISMEATQSKVSFIIENDSIVDTTKLKALGATGVVQTNKKVTAIFGKVSKALVEAIERKR